MKEIIIIHTIVSVIIVMMIMIITAIRKDTMEEDITGHQVVDIEKDMVAGIKLI